MVSLIGGGRTSPASPLGPTQPTINSQLRVAVEAYFTEHPVQPGPAGRPPTAGEIMASVTAYLVANPPSGATVTAEQVQPVVQAYLADNIDTLLAAHIQAQEPHPNYDDMQSLVLIYENGLI